MYNKTKFTLFKQKRPPETNLGLILLRLQTSHCISPLPLLKLKRVRIFKAEILYKRVYFSAIFWLILYNKNYNKTKIKQWTSN